MTSYTAAIAMAEMINKNSSWLRATAIESISLTANFQLLLNEPARRPHTLIVSMISFHWLASRGKEPFTTRYDGLRFIATMGYHMQGFITLDPEIKTLDDFTGKKVSIGDRSSVTRVEMIKAILRSAGVLDKVKLEYLSLPGGVNAMRDGLIDATLGSATLVRPPYRYALPSYLNEITSTRKVYFVSMDEADIASMNELLGPFETEHTVPAGRVRVHERRHAHQVDLFASRGEKPCLEVFGRSLHQFLSGAQHRRDAGSVVGGSLHVAAENLAVQQENYR